MKWFIEYKVEGFGDQVAGPYDFDEVQSQLSDISGFEGVKNARLVSEDEHICHPCNKDVVFYIDMGACRDYILKNLISEGFGRDECDALLNAMISSHQVVGNDDWLIVSEFMPRTAKAILLGQGIDPPQWMKNL